jgi:rod shape-determining protein MreD
VPVARSLLAAFLLFVATVLQLVVLARLPLPGGTPDLVLLVVIGLALASGPTTGAVAGFAGGLMLDAAPPADGTLGRWALVLCLAGWVAGRAQDLAERSAFVPVAVVALLAPATLVAYAGLGLLLGDPRVTAQAVANSVPSATLYDVLLAPFIVPLVGYLCRRVEPRSPVY